MNFFYIYFGPCDLADSKVCKTFNSFILSPLVHEMWTAEGVKLPIFISNSTLKRKILLDHSPYRKER